MIRTCSYLLAVTFTLPTCARSEDAKPIDKGQRVFTTGHSFHVFVPGILRPLAIDGGYKDHVHVGTSSIGGSRVIQHWDVADDKNTAKKALIEGKVDVLTMSPIYLPDDGIEKFVELGLKHNPNLRVTIQEFWLPFDVYDPLYQKKRPTLVDRNTRTVEQMRKEHEPYFKSMDDHVRELNKKHGKSAVFVVPVGQAVILLRQKIIEGKAPTLKNQDDIFTDAIGHVKAPVQALNAYCHYAVIYRKSPVGLPVPAVMTKSKEPFPDEKLNRLLQELAWEAVIAHPLSGVKVEEKR
jgi:hypothetical protein